MIDPVNRERLMMEKIAKDFRVFLALVWKHLRLPKPTKVQYDIATYLQHGDKRIVIEAFRGVGKSWITSAFVCWLLLTDPQKKILVISASKERSDSFSTFTKRLIAEMPILQHLVAKNGQRDSNVAFDVAPTLPAHAPSVKSVGITGQITGSRADIIIADDIETPNNSYTQLLRDKLGEAIKEFDAVITPKPKSRIIYLGTPQTEMSIYNQLPERGYSMRIWPSRVPKSDKVNDYQGRLAPIVMKMIEELPEGTPVDPERFDHEDLLDRELSYGRSGFALQFMLDTSLSDGDRYPLKLNDLIVMDVSGDLAPTEVAWAGSNDYALKDLPSVGLVGDLYHKPMFISDDFTKFQGSVMAIDPSGRGGDETGYAVVKHLFGKLYVTRAGGIKGGYSPETLEALALIAKEQKVNLVITESNFGDGMFTELFKPVLKKHHPCTIEETRATGQKELRIIDTLEPVLNQHRLIVDTRVIQDDLKKSDPNCSLFYQLTRLTRERGALRHDDIIDALEIAVKYWTTAMATSENEAAERHREEVLRNELNKFMDNILGGNPGNSLNWTTNY